jgi:hypothetical protein
MHQRFVRSLVPAPRLASPSLSFSLSSSIGPTWSASACLVSLLAAFTGCTGAIGGQTALGAGGNGSTAGTAGTGSTAGSAGGGGGTNTGGPDGGSSTGTGGVGTDAGPTVAPLPSALPTESACTSNSPGPRVLRRLSAAEFAASIVDLFGDSTAPVTDVFNDPLVLGFSVDSNALLVQDLNADQLMTNAETVATWAVANHLTQIAPCTAFTSACGRQIIESFGRRAFRTAMPDSDPRVDVYSKLFLAEANFTDAVTTVVTTMLQSPYFLYRGELGGTPAAGAATVALTPYEVASSLSYLLTGSMPDTTLLAAADAVAGGTLTMSNMIDQQSARLLTLPSSQDAVMGFMRGWLGLDRLYTTVKDDSVYMLTDAQRDDMANETRSFILDTFSSTTYGTVSNLFTANYSFLNKNMAQYYGMDTTGLTSSFVKVPYTAATPRDGGILAQASILVGYAKSNISSPTQRGHLVRTRLLCQNVPDPPPGVDTAILPPASVGLTTRDLYLSGHDNMNASPPTNCYTCHQLMDLIGVSSEHYDAFGAYRTQENGVTIDSTGTILNSDATGDTVAIDGLGGPNGLQTYLGNSDDLKHCMVRYWSYYAYGTSSWAQDGCTYDAIQTEAASGSFGLKNVLMSIIHAPHFTSRALDQ